MAEPITERRLRQLRALVDFPSGQPINCQPVNLADVAGILARLDLAERRLAAVCGVLRRSHEQIKQDVEYAAKNDTSELRLTLREAEVREGIVRSIRADVEQAANG